ncbi:unnamed protein product [Linum trigynum]|uniref:Uncharacterized protein n=1 Tax=Linum trigynum TaxID=586398 RepID=A0AAV2F5X8_9ROSI
MSPLRGTRISWRSFDRERATRQAAKDSKEEAVEKSVGWEPEEPSCSVAGGNFELRFSVKKLDERGRNLMAMTKATTDESGSGG